MAGDRGNGATDIPGTGSKEGGSPDPPTARSAALPIPDGRGCAASLAGQETRPPYGRYALTRLISPPPR
ncbi:hypothetical protein Ga0100231_021280 [Opitutaceae bacterium TAV4]|nr:hypothetical protein Ga0100231_021280 [Opitutaceae bacterium TAV4]